MRLILCLMLALAAVLSACSDKSVSREEGAVLGEATTAYNRKDYATAYRLFMQLAEKGNPTAQYNIGWMHANGQGVVQDYAVASRWFQNPAGKGNATAQYNLGWIYANGLGVPQDYVRAHMWFSLAAVTGDADAVKNLDGVAKRMTPQKIAEAQKLLRECQAKQFKGCD